MVRTGVGWAWACIGSPWLHGRSFACFDCHYCTARTTQQHAALCLQEFVSLGVLSLTITLGLFFVGGTGGSLASRNDQQVVYMVDSRCAERHVPPVQWASGA